MSETTDLDNLEKMASLIASDATWTPDPEGPSDIQTTDIAKKQQASIGRKLAEMAGEADCLIGVLNGHDRLDVADNLTAAVNRLYIAARDLGWEPEPSDDD